MQSILVFWLLITLAFVSGHSVAASNRFGFQEIKLPCAPGCEANGNCNAEFGRCECRYGFGGEDCSQPLLPACMSSLEKGAVPQYGITLSRNCYCYKQLQKISCKGEYWKDALLCDQTALWRWEEIWCYEYTDRPESEQLSNVPAPGASGVVWKRGVRKWDVEGPESFALEVANEAPQDRNVLRTALPLERCPNRCNERGTCVENRGSAPACLCAPFYTAPACERAQLDHCPLSCSGRGSCHGGFCHCQPGFWGVGCTRSKAYTAPQWTPHPTELRIYVYDLPESVSYMRPEIDDWPLHNVIYLAEIELYHRLLGDTSLRTENPWEANLFYIPTNTYYYIGNVGFPGKHYTRVFHYVRDTYPWWNLTAGRNHVAASSNDRGCCDVYRMGADAQHPIKIVHFAQWSRPGVPQWRGAKVVEWSEQPELLAKRLNTDMEDPAMHGAMAEFQHLAGRPRFKGFPLFALPALHQEREQCYRPDHDVAFPPHLDTNEWNAVLGRAYDYRPDGSVTFRRGQGRERDIFFYFAGSTSNEMAYSAGVRQGLLALFGDLGRPDVWINKGGGSQELLRSVFCFTPMGFGWGIRLSQAAFAGCIPVMTHDHVWPTLWDVLPYERFSVRVSRHNLHRLFDLLDAITPEQVRRLQDGLAEVHRAFVWQPELGGLAYNYTMLSLHRRLLNMWNAIF